jgi:hypothetical protein
MSGEDSTVETVDHEHHQHHLLPVVWSSTTTSASSTTVPDHSGNSCFLKNTRNTDELVGGTSFKMLTEQKNTQEDRFSRNDDCLVEISSTSTSRSSISTIEDIGENASTSTTSTVVRTINSESPTALASPRCYQQLEDDHEIPPLLLVHDHAANEDVNKDNVYGQSGTPLLGIDDNAHQYLLLQGAFTFDLSSSSSSSDGREDHSASNLTYDDMMNSLLVLQHYNLLLQTEQTSAKDEDFEDPNDAMSLTKYGCLDSNHQEVDDDCSSRQVLRDEAGKCPSSTLENRECIEGVNCNYNPPADPLNERLLGGKQAMAADTEHRDKVENNSTRSAIAVGTSTFLDGGQGEVLAIDDDDKEMSGHEPVVLLSRSREHDTIEEMPDKEEQDRQEELATKIVKSKSDDLILFSSSEEADCSSVTLSYHDATWMSSCDSETKGKDLCLFFYSTGTSSSIANLVNNKSQNDLLNAEHIRWSEEVTSVISAAKKNSFIKTEPSSDIKNRQEDVLYKLDSANYTWNPPQEEECVHPSTAYLDSGAHQRNMCNSHCIITPEVSLLVKDKNLDDKCRLKSKTEYTEIKQLCCNKEDQNILDDTNNSFIVKDESDFTDLTSTKNDDINEDYHNNCQEDPSVTSNNSVQSLLSTAEEERKKITICVPRQEVQNLDCSMLGGGSHSNRKNKSCPAIKNKCNNSKELFTEERSNSTRWHHDKNEDFEKSGPCVYFASVENNTSLITESIHLDQNNGIQSNSSSAVKDGGRKDDSKCNENAAVLQGPLSTCNNFQPTVLVSPSLLEDKKLATVLPSTKSIHNLEHVTLKQNDTNILPTQHHTVRTDGGNSNKCSGDGHDRGEPEDSLTNDKCDEGLDITNVKKSVLDETMLHASPDCLQLETLSVNDLNYAKQNRHTLYAENSFDECSPTERINRNLAYASRIASSEAIESCLSIQNNMIRFPNDIDDNHVINSCTSMDDDVHKTYFSYNDPSKKHESSFESRNDSESSARVTGVSFCYPGSIPTNRRPDELLAQQQPSYTKVDPSPTSEEGSEPAVPKISTINIKEHLTGRVLERLEKSNPRVHHSSSFSTVLKEGGEHHGSFRSNFDFMTLAEQRDESVVKAAAALSGHRSPRSDAAIEKPSSSFSSRLHRTKSTSISIPQVDSDAQFVAVMEQQIDDGSINEKQAAGLLKVRFLRSHGSPGANVPVEKLSSFLSRPHQTKNNDSIPHVDLSSVHSKLYHLAMKKRNIERKRKILQLKQRLNEGAETMDIAQEEEVQYPMRWGILKDKKYNLDQSRIQKKVDLQNEQLQEHTDFSRDLLLSSVREGPSESSTPSMSRRQFQLHRKTLHRSRDIMPFLDGSSRSWSNHQELHNLCDGTTMSSRRGPDHNNVNSSMRSLSPIIRRSSGSPFMNSKSSLTNAGNTSNSSRSFRVSSRYATPERQAQRCSTKIHLRNLERQLNHHRSNLVFQRGMEHENPPENYH